MDERGDLTLRTVVFQNDINQMGVVVNDWGEERVVVDFGEKRERTPHYDRGGVYVDRSDLTDVTDDYNLAVAWGYIEDEEDED